MAKNGLLHVTTSTTEAGTSTYKFFTFWIPEILTIEIFYASDVDLKQLGNAASFQDIQANGNGRARPGGWWILSLGSDTTGYE